MEMNMKAIFKTMKNQGKEYIDIRVDRFITVILKKGKKMAMGRCIFRMVIAMRGCGKVA